MTHPSLDKREEKTLLYSTFYLNPPVTHWARSPRLGRTLGASEAGPRICTTRVNVVRRARHRILVLARQDLYTIYNM